MTNAPTAEIVGILLAAGQGTRFGGDKLLATLAGEGVGAVSCRRLVSVLPRVLAIVRPEDRALAAALAATGASVVRCRDAELGMGASLACGVAASKDAGGWIVALADMPWILPSTIASVAAALSRGARVAVPFHSGMRGHPVGFSSACMAALSTLTGDEGAKSVVAACRDDVVRIDVDDPGVLRDVDTPADLREGPLPM